MLGLQAQRQSLQGPVPNPTLWFYFLFQMNKARSSSSTEYITLQSALPGDTQATSLSMVWASRQTPRVILQMEDWAQGWRPCSRATEAPPTARGKATYPTPSPPGKAGPAAPHVLCRLSSKPGFQDDTAWVTVRTSARYTGTLSPACSATLLGLARFHLAF